MYVHLYVNVINFTSFIFLNGLLNNKMFCLKLKLRFVSNFKNFLYLQRVRQRFFKKSEDVLKSLKGGNLYSYIVFLSCRQYSMRAPSPPCGGNLENCFFIAPRVLIFCARFRNSHREGNAPSCGNNLICFFIVCNWCLMDSDFEVFSRGNIGGLCNCCLIGRYKVNETEFKFWKNMYGEQVFSSSHVVSKIFPSCNNWDS